VCDESEGESAAWGRLERGAEKQRRGFLLAEGTRAFEKAAGLLIFGMRVETRDSRQVRKIGAFREVFEILKTNGDADLGFGPSRDVLIRICQGTRHAEHASFAAHGHVVAKRNGGGHAKGEFNRGTFRDRSIAKQENSARAQVLGETGACNRIGLTERNRQEQWKSLSNAAFNPY
jgi:hypothetical protein